MGERDSRRRGGAELGEKIARTIASQMARKLRHRPEVARKLIDAGLLDDDFSSIDPDAIDDPLGLLASFGTAIAERIRDNPSTLARLDLSAIDVLGRGSVEETSTAADSTRGERVVLFTDLEGFTSFTEDEGDTAAAELLTDHYGVVERFTRSRGGDVIKRLGDGHMLSFRAPEAAVLAGLEIIEAAPAPLRLRAGAHAGPVVVSSGDLLGNVVNIASRVAGSASGGQALVTGAVYQEAAALSGVHFESTPPRQLRGLDDPMALWEVYRVPR